MCVNLATIYMSIDIEGRESCLAFHGPFLFPTLDEVFGDPIRLLQEPLKNTGHLSYTIVFLDYRLVLIHNHGDTLE